MLTNAMIVVPMRRRSFEQLVGALLQTGIWLENAAIDIRHAHTDGCEIYIKLDSPQIQTLKIVASNGPEIPTLWAEKAPELPVKVTLTGSRAEPPTIQDMAIPKNLTNANETLQQALWMVQCESMLRDLVDAIRSNHTIQNAVATQGPARAAYNYALEQLAQHDVARANAYNAEPALSVVKDIAKMFGLPADHNPFVELVPYLQHYMDEQQKDVKASRDQRNKLLETVSRIGAMARHETQHLDESSGQWERTVAAENGNKR